MDIIGQAEVRELPEKTEETDTSMDTDTCGVELYQKSFGHNGIWQGTPATRYKKSKQFSTLILFLLHGHRARPRVHFGKKNTCQPTSSRFALPVSEEQFSDAAMGVIPFNTKKNNAWAERTFNSWVEERNKRTPGSVPTDLLLCRDPATASTCAICTGS